MHAKNIARQPSAFKPARLCAALLAAGIALPAWAQSSVTLYGTVDLGLAYSSNQGGASNTYMNSGALAASKLGLTGTEDLGGGNMALFRLENGFNADTGAQSTAGVLFNRQSYVGLSSKDYGQVTVGRQYTPYFQYVGALGPTNVLTGATGAHPGDIDALDTTLRMNNSITYTLPTLGGLQAGVQYGMGEQAGSAANGSSVSAALRYDYQAFSWSAGYTRLKNLANGNTAGSFGNVGSFANNSPVNAGYASADSTQLLATAARYTRGDLMLGLNYSNVQYKAGALSAFSQTAVFNTIGLIGSYNVSPALVLAAGYSYTAEKARNGISSPAKYNQLSLEEVYSLSKRTALYAIQAYQRASGQTLRAGGVGSGIVNAVASVGDSQNGTPSSGSGQFVAMLGIRHSF
ncbi:porin [Herbaspirillum seropedicae]|uniref:porin n=1 Tax=Herbaspirillum seropedicae TaxID=964 RepID=UPI003FCE016D